MTDQQIVIYATEWCYDCRRARNFMEKHGIPYRWINIDKDKAGEEFVIEVNQGNRSVPTLVFPDGDILVEPSNQALSHKTGRA
jgi:mycoredoxin